MRLLYQLGLHDKTTSRGSSRSNITIHSLQGRILGEQDMVGCAREQTGFGYVRIKRTDLLDVLLEAVHQAEIPIHYNKRLTSIEENEDGVTVAFSDGMTDTGDLLLGCDGIHSSVRGLYVDPDQSPEYSGWVSLGALLPASAVSELSASQIRGLNATLTQEGMFMAMTCTASDDMICWGFSEEVPLPRSGDARDGWEVHRREEVERSKTTLLALLENAKGGWGSTMKEIVEKTTTLKLYPIYRLPLGRPWFRGRCLLLGDAAHAMQPHAGQGVSMALEDTFLLSRLLEDGGRPLREALQRFERIRRPRVNRVANLAIKNAQVRKRSGPYGLWLKETVIWTYMRVSRVLRLDGGVSDQKHLVYDIEQEQF